MVFWPKGGVLNTTTQKTVRRQKMNILTPLSSNRIGYPNASLSLFSKRRRNKNAIKAIHPFKKENFFNTIRNEHLWILGRGPPGPIYHAAGPGFH